MTEEQIGVLRHATGADSSSPGYRNRYCTEVNDANCLALVEAGLMSGPQHADGIFGKGTGIFYVTEKGFKLLGFKEQR